MEDSFVPNNILSTIAETNSVFFIAFLFKRKIFATMENTLKNGIVLNNDLFSNIERESDSVVSISKGVGIFFKRVLYFIKNYYITCPIEY